MVRPTSGDRPVESTDATVEGQASIAPASGELADEQTLADSEQTARARLDAADERDKISEARDLAAQARDDAAAARSLATAQLGGGNLQDDGGRELTESDNVTHATGRHESATQQRVQAAEQHTLAAQDRQAAAQDREHARRERRQALVDREALARQLAITETDPLTGARTRAAGLTDLDNELDRCRRTNSNLVVAYIDVVGLKTVNDTQGHAAGDELLTRVVTLIKEHLRPYDLIIRLGGDEFLCAMSNMTLRHARQRFSEIVTALARAPHSAAIRTGFAEPAPNQPATELIARADSDLIDSRRG